MVEALSPKDIGLAKSKAIPENVIKIFNDLIALNYCNGRANVRQDDVTQKYRELHPGDVFVTEWLNVEALYESKGWKVTYDKADWTETDPQCLHLKDEKNRTS